MIMSNSLSLLLLLHSLSLRCLLSREKVIISCDENRKSLWAFTHEVKGSHFSGSQHKVKAVVFLLLLSWQLSIVVDTLSAAYV